MENTPQFGLRFVPRSVEGMADVTEVAIFPNRLELQSENNRVSVRFLDIAEWYRKGWLYFPLARLGFGIFGGPLVADRLWRPPPYDCQFEFYTNPRLVVFVPNDAAGIPLADTLFQRCKWVMGMGGFGTFDLG